jgi:hypothetical protein
MRDDDVDATEEYFHGHTSAEGLSDNHPSAEGFLSSVQNRPPGVSPGMIAGRGGP